MEVINNVQAPANMNLVTLPAQGQSNLGNSATFQRLGMKASERGLPSLEVSHLETKPLSPVDVEENTQDDVKKKEMTNNGQSKFQRVKKVLSPASAEVLARRDSVRAKLGSQRMSRKTLTFQSPMDVNGSTNADPGIQSSVPQEARRSGKDRVELGDESVSWSRVTGGVSSKSEDDEVTRTVVKKPKEQNHRLVQVMLTVRPDLISLYNSRMENRNKDFQHLSHISEKPSEVSVEVHPDSDLRYDRSAQGFDNPGYESQSAVSDQERVRGSVISPPRRSSVIR